MPATEETYRSQPFLHLVFAVSSVAMLLSTVWMVMADHLRPWKQFQREFQGIEHDKLVATEKEKDQELRDKYQAQLDEINRQIQEAEANAETRAAELRKLDREIDRLGGRAEYLDIRRRFKKADLDSKRSLYDGMIDRGEEHEARSYLTTVVAGAQNELNALAEQAEQAQKELNAKKEEKERLLGFVDNLKKKRDDLTRDVDRVKRSIQQKEELYGAPNPSFSRLMAWLRGLPGIDLMPPTKIQQISLPELTINYNFKEVPRYDRCTTCHQGIDRLGYEFYKTPDDQQKQMPKVFASHPFLTSGSTAIDPKGKVVTAGLYLDGNGPHPLNSFGCTICHAGQGSGTDFTFASHTPDTLKQAEEWHAEHGWREIHFWDFPMLPKRFLESSCLKCHHEVTDIPQAQKLQAGYQRIVRYGCTGCHTIGGEGTIGPDLTEEPQVGPNLSHVKFKVAPDWIRRWILDPHAFRPDSRMPRFYGLTNNGAPEDWPKNHAEVNAIVHYLFARSTEPPGFVDPPAKTDPARGKELFLQKGCLACHSHRPYEQTEIQQADRTEANPDYYDSQGVPKLAATATYDPKMFPQSVRQDARADYGPNLSNIAAKFQSQPQGLKWLANWIHAPENYHPKSLMPNLQLSLQDAADIASWIISVPGEWPVKVVVPDVSKADDVKKAVDDLVKLYVEKSGTFKKADGKSESVALSEVDDYVTHRLGLEEKLLYLGERTISRLGCFGCHTIPGFENAKPIGTGLSDWGVKSPARLDYGHIREYLEEQAPDGDGTRDGTDLFYQEKVTHETRMGFLFQKLHRPRSFDYLKKNEKYKPWDDRLRMPQFAWANDPQAIEEVMTFVLGLTNERVAARYLPKTHYTPTQTAVARGAKVVSRHNCTGCHVLEMPRFTIPAGVKVAEAFTDLKANLRSSYQGRGNDYLADLSKFLGLDPPLTYDPTKKLDANNIERELGLSPDEGKQPITIEGMPVGLFENELSVAIWRPVKVRGYTFNIGDNVTLDQTKIQRSPSTGGNFAWLYSTYQADRTGTPFEQYWNRLPPPLLREGNKVQTPWLTAFLKDPYPIRPATQLRMPRFHYDHAGIGQGRPRETVDLANYFAARDRAEFPYQTIDEHTAGYLAQRDQAHPNYLGAGWEMMTYKGSPCVQCHAVGQHKPSGGQEVVNGPDLRQVSSRFRPDFLWAWLANPRRLIPYTAMPQNIVPRGAVQIQVPKTFENQPADMVTAIRDTLLNYVNAVELQLASSTNGGAGPPGGGAAKPARPTP